MRRQLVFVLSRTTAKRYCPWAAVIAKVEAGFLAFSSREDYLQWKKQK